MRSLAATLACAALASFPWAARAQPSPAPSATASTPADSDFERTFRIAPAPTPLPPCATAKITPLASINSRDAQPGASFKFDVASVDDPQARYTSVAPGAQGYGMVSVVRRGRTGGEPGFLVLEARYIVARDGTHVPVAMLRTVNGLFMGRTNNSPALLGLIPYVGYVTETYDALHKGGDTSAGPADTLIVLVGDDAIEGTCRPPPPPPPVKK